MICVHGHSKSVHQCYVKLTTNRMKKGVAFFLLIPFISFSQEVDRVDMLSKSFPDTQGNYVSFADANEKQYFTISGHLGNYDGKPEFFRMWDYGLLTDEMTTVDISNSGDFDVTIPIYYSHEITLLIDNKIYVLVAHPDNKIHMEFDQNKTVKFFGDGALDAKVNNQYYENIWSKYRSDPPIERNDILSIDPPEYRKVVDQRYHDWRKDLSEFFARLDIRDGSISSFIRRNRLMDVNFDYLNQINAFDSYRKYKNKEKVKLEPIPKSFYQNLVNEEIQLEKVDYTYQDLEVLLDEGIYSDYLDKIRIKISKTGIAKKILRRAKLDIPTWQYDWLFGHFYGYRGEVKFSDELITDFVKGSETKWLKNEILKIHEGKEITDAIYLAKGIDTTDVSQMDFDDLLNIIVTKHAGKTIYLDIWGTWCTNCIYQFSFSDDLHRSVNKDKVAFVYFAVRSDENLWLKRIEKSNLTGDHYFLSDDQYNRMSKRWKTPGLPQYVIIGPDGRVLNQNAPRPSVDNELNQELVILLSD